MSRTKWDHLNTIYTESRHAYDELFAECRKRYDPDSGRFGCDTYGRLTWDTLYRDVENTAYECGIAPYKNVLHSVAYALFARDCDDGIVASKLWGKYADRWFTYLTGV